MTSLTTTVPARKIETPIRVAKPLQPATGTCGVLRRIGEVNDVTGEISINGQAYYVQRHDDGYRLIGWDSRKATATMYDLPSDLMTCDCPDATFRSERPGGCKHRKSLVALSAAGKL